MFNVDGQMVDAFGLKKGRVVTATKIVEVPEVEVSQQKHVTGTVTAPPSAPPADVPILIAKAEPTPAPAAAEAPAAPAKTLPKTGSELPLIGLLGLLCLTASLGVKLLRANISV